MVTRARADLHLVRCSIGEMTVGLEVNRIAAVERGDRLTRRPTAAAPGLFRTRQGDWPVYALGEARGAGGQVVLFDGPRGRAGLLVDRVSPVERVPHAAVAPVPVGAGGAARAFSGVALTDAGPLAVLAVDELGTPDGADVPAFGEVPDAGPAPAHGPTGPQRLLTFGRASRPGGRMAVLAVPVASVAEVFDAPPGAQLPGAPAHVRELVVWRERPLVVIDAARWVGLPAPATAARRVVVVRSGGRAIGALAGSEVQVLSGSVLCVPSPRPVSLTRERVAAVLDTSDRTLIVPDWVQLLGSAAR